MAEAIGKREGRFWGMFAEWVFVVSDSSFERQVAAGTRSVGQLAALGDPLKRRRSGEARRLNIKGPEWQAAVDHLLSKVSLAVLLHSPRQSVSWEGVRVLEQSDVPALVWMPQLVTKEQFDAGFPME